MRNDNKNDKAVKFTPDYQPSPEAKKAGWERRKQAQEMMNKVKEYMSMSQSEFQKLLDDIKKNPEKYTVQDVLLYKYATKAFNGDKFMLDWFDRNISKAPQDVDLKSDGEKIEGIVLKIINSNDSADAGNKRTEQNP